MHFNYFQKATDNVHQSWHTTAQVTLFKTYSYNADLTYIINNNSNNRLQKLKYIQKQLYFITILLQT